MKIKSFICHSNHKNAWGMGQFSFQNASKRKKNTKFHAPLRMKCHEILHEVAAFQFSIFQNFRQSKFKKNLLQIVSERLRLLVENSPYSIAYQQSEMNNKQNFNLCKNQLINCK